MSIGENNVWYKHSSKDKFHIELRLMLKITHKQKHNITSSGWESGGGILAKEFLICYSVSIIQIEMAHRNMFCSISPLKL